jgi:hypothetical protein
MNKKRFNERSKRFFFDQQPLTAKPNPLYERILGKDSPTPQIFLKS